MNDREAENGAEQASEDEARNGNGAEHEAGNGREITRSEDRLNGGAAAYKADSGSESAPHGESGRFKHAAPEWDAFYAAIRSGILRMRPEKDGEAGG